MIHLATGNDVLAARKALGVSQTALATYWGLNEGRGREVIGDWERCGDGYVPMPRVVAILLSSIRRGWFPAGGEGVKKRRRQPAAEIPGQAIRDALGLLELTPQQLAAYWGMSVANLFHLMAQSPLSRSAMYDILLDDLLRTRRALVLRWSTTTPPAQIPRTPRGRYAKQGATDEADAPQAAPPPQLLPASLVTAMQSLDAQVHGGA